MCLFIHARMCIPCPVTLRLGKLHHDITQLRQISPPPELGSFVSLGVDETVSALDGISDALARAEATPTSRLEEWLLLLLVDVSFYCKLGQSVLDTLKTLDRWILFPWS